MKRAAWIGGVLLAAAPAFALRTGDVAPELKVNDSHGLTQTLAAQKGKFVVLEWHNKGCPFVRKHYESKNMQKLQRELVGRDLVWFTVISSAKGKQGNVTAESVNAYVKKVGASPSAVLLDTDGKVGMAYSARTTPHMFVIDPQGKLIYQGAIDDQNSTDAKTVKIAKNYVLAAVTEARAGKAVTEATTEPYGCSVKY